MVLAMPSTPGSIPAAVVSERVESHEVRVQKTDSLTSTFLFSERFETSTLLSWLTVRGAALHSLQGEALHFSCAATPAQPPNPPPPSPVLLHQVTTAGHHTAARSQKAQPCALYPVCPLPTITAALIGFICSMSPTPPRDF